MALPGRASTYDLTVGVIVDIEDTIHLISPTDIPLLGGMGAEGGSALSTDTCFEKTINWLDEELLLPKSTVQTGATTGDAFLIVASGHRNRFSTGDTLIVGNAGNERMRVTGYGTTADYLLVTRGFQSSTAGTVTAGQSILVLGQTLAEGSDPEAARAADRSLRTNYTQIFGPTKVHVTGTENVVRKYGLRTSEFDKQAANRTKEQWIQLEQAVLYGLALEDSSNSWRTMGGMTGFITTNVNSSTTTITEATILDQIQACYDLGGDPNRLVVGSKTKRVISGFVSGITVNVVRPDNVRGTVVEFFDTDFGRTTMILDRWCRTADAFGFNRDQATVVTLRPMQFEMLAKTGDAVSGQVLMEKTFRFVRQAHAYRFSALT